MKEFLSNIKRLFINIGLMLLAFAIVSLIVFPALYWLIKVSLFNNKDNARDMIVGVSTWNLAIAGAMDKFGNCAYGGYLNSILLINVLHPFGNSSETVSAVLGWAYYYNDLTNLGLRIRKIVNWFDKSTRDHCEYYRIVSVKNSRKIVNEYLNLPV